MALVDGWTCAVRTGAFTRDEAVLLCEIDSFVSSTDPRFQHPLHHGATAWSGSRGVHVKSVMVNRSSHISQGLVLKLADFPEVQAAYYNDKEKALDTCFAEMLGVRKWEVAPGEAGTSLGPSPAFFPKTDAERVQNIKTLFTNKYANATFQESVKMDGSSMTVYYVRNDSQFYKSVPALPEGARKADLKNGRVGVSSRKVDLSCADEKKNVFWITALRYGLPWKLHRLGRNIAIQGELVGATMNRNRHGYGKGQHDFFVFAIYDIDKQQYMPPKDVEVRARELGLKHVPVLGYVNIHKIAKSQDDLLKRAEGVGMNGKKREGLVYKNVQDGRWFKAIANNYLLAIGE